MRTEEWKKIKEELAKVLEMDLSERENYLNNAGIEETSAGKLNH